MLNKKSENSSEKAYAHIKNSILDGVLNSGDRLKEDMIAHEIKVSRTPIRDAIKRLEFEGLVSSSPHAGARVTKWEHGELTELSKMRVLLEGYATELAARKITEIELQQLRDNCSEVEINIKKCDYLNVERMLKLNLQFHKIIVSASRNKRLMATIEPLWAMPIISVNDKSSTCSHYSKISKLKHSNENRNWKSLNHHVEIVMALQQNDSVWAGSAMRTHIRAASLFDKVFSKSDL